MNTLTINGTDLPIFVDASLSFDKPEKDVETFRVPGRSGDLVVDYGTYQNVVITYPCFIKNSFDSVFDDILDFLGSLEGYQRIECSNDSSHFRMGVPIIPAHPTPKMINRQGYFDLSFNCKPQRFLKSGENEIVLNSSGTVTNPTSFASRPLIRVVGDGLLTFNGTAIMITDIGTVDIDCEAMECYYGSLNRNQNVSFAGINNDFPTLSPGSNTITFGSGISQVRIIPRWWEL